MTVLIDPPRWPAHGRVWSHLVSDVSLEELHEFARRVGIPARAFSGDHYDVPQDRYADAVQGGATQVEARDLLVRLVASGLRIPKRRGEHVLTSRRVRDWLPGSGAAVLDLIASTLAVPAASVVSTRVVVQDVTGRVLAVPVGTGWQLPAAPIVGSEQLSRAGFHRLRLDGDPSPTYRGPRPWACVTYLSGQDGAGAVDVPGARWVGPEPALRDLDEWPLVARLLRERRPP